MRASSAKAKGRRLAQKLRDKILSSFLVLQEDDVRVTPSGVTGEDLLLSPLARQYVPFSIECKNVEKLNIWAALKQAESEARKFPALLIFSRNRSKTYACMDVDVLLGLLQRADITSADILSDLRWFPESE
jgi:hypothetical protein